MGLASVRIAYRMLYEHLRARISGSARETRRALVLGAGDAARLLLAGLQHQAGWWRACSTTTRPSNAPASAACR
ncbi:MULTISPECIES: hypothetical protein [unclassified Methylibium]|uniref:nucleoside-diphosphate sugar epimerase/dehydratase n=1 Tax=unclassified Methylibium TaxID=2633235 RepID=UPI0004B94B7B|nr:MULTISPECIES: hypothetical protein [unclassified Methylibium]